MSQSRGKTHTDPGLPSLCREKSVFHVWQGANQLRPLKSTTLSPSFTVLRDPRVAQPEDELGADPAWGGRPSSHHLFSPWRRAGLWLRTAQRQAGTGLSGQLSCWFSRVLVCASSHKMLQKQCVCISVMLNAKTKIEHCLIKQKESNVYSIQSITTVSVITSRA